mmetsp:Transcript_100503/g.324340  ORF Transcript_100503/g.324340 Transcript_100503/m.324340 type:complete len:234 (+) Transcript_100503:794-1495(+)
MLAALRPELLLFPRLRCLRTSRPPHDGLACHWCHRHPPRRRSPPCRRHLSRSLRSPAAFYSAGPSCKTCRAAAQGVPGLWTAGLGHRSRRRGGPPCTARAARAPPPTGGPMLPLPPSPPGPVRCVGALAAAGSAPPTHPPLRPARRPRWRTPHGPRAAAHSRSAAWPCKAAQLPPPAPPPPERRRPGHCSPGRQPSAAWRPSSLPSAQRRPPPAPGRGRRAQGTRARRWPSPR